MRFPVGTQKQISSACLQLHFQIYWWSSFISPPPQTEGSFLKHSPNAYTEMFMRYICFTCVSWKMCVTKWARLQGTALGAWLCLWKQTARWFFAGSVSEELRAFSIFEGTRKFPGLYTGGPSPLMLLKEALLFVTVLCSEAKMRVSETLQQRDCFKIEMSNVIFTYLTSNNYISELLVCLDKVVKNWFNKKTVWGTKTIHKLQIHVVCENSLSQKIKPQKV